MTSAPAPATVPVIHELFAYLRVKDSAAAIAFYTVVFGGKERFRLVEPSGRIGHAEVDIGPGTLMLSDEFPEFGLTGPRDGQVPGVSLHLHVDNADALAERAVAAGATLLMPPTDHFYGERSCRLRDPFGHLWLIGHAIETVSPEEMQRRYTAMMTS